MNLHLIDSTLREGLQVPGGLNFRDDESMSAYVDNTSGLGLIERFEIFMPGPHISDDAWQKIITAQKDKVQVYVGPAHKFNIDEREELLGRAWPMLSTTLIRRDRSSLDKLSEISESTDNSSLRVGLECAGEIHPARTLELIHSLGQVANVAVVSINDSNSRIDRTWINSFTEELADQGSVKIPKLGLHLHNGKISALEKAKHFTQKLGDVGLADVELDVAAFGVGDRQGILSVVEAINLTHGSGTNMAEKYDNIGSQFIVKREIASLTSRDSAVSHYDNLGNLRPEYLYTDF